MLYGIPQLNCRARVSTQVGSLSYGPWPSLQLPSSASVHIVVLMIIAHRLNCLLHSNDQAQTSNVYFTEFNAYPLNSATEENRSNECNFHVFCFLYAILFALICLLDQFKTQQGQNTLASNLSAAL